MVTYRAECDDLVLGTGVSIADTAVLRGGRIEIGDGTRINAGVAIDVTERLTIGKLSILGEGTILRGRDIVLGREFYTNHHAEIGGGSCFEKSSSLRMGYWGHLGSYSVVNTAMPVEAGSEVGLGRFTNIYTHGAYLSEIDGFPVSFGAVSLGDRVWLPSATVNPGIRIGSDVVVGVGSVVTGDLPSGCLAIGAPARIVKENAYPAPMSPRKVLEVVERILQAGCVAYAMEDASAPAVRVDNAMFDFRTREARGTVSPDSERARNLLRRHGIRFKVDTESGEYEPWRE